MGGGTTWSMLIINGERTYAICSFCNCCFKKNNGRILAIYKVPRKFLIADSYLVNKEIKIIKALYSVGLYIRL